MKVGDKVVFRGYTGQVTSVWRYSKRGTCYYIGFDSDHTEKCTRLGFSSGSFPEFPSLEELEDYLHNNADIGVQPYPIKTKVKYYGEDGRLYGDTGVILDNSLIINKRPVYTVSIDGKNKYNVAHEDLATIASGVESSKQPPKILLNVKLLNVNQDE